MYDDLRFTLELEGGDANLEVPCGNISNVEVNIHSYGFEGVVTFWINQEEVPFLTDLPVIKLILTIKSQSAPEELEPLKLEGIVTNRVLLNEAVNQDTSALKVLSRTFQFEFRDPLQVEWGHSYPSEIATEKSLEDVLKEYVPDEVKFNIEAAAAKESRPLIALGLGHEENKASLYSFLTWLCEQEEFILDYDYKKGEYFLRDKKDESAKPVVLPRDEGQRTLTFPEPNRTKPRIYNNNTRDPKLDELDGEELLPKATRDYLISTPIQKEAQAISQKRKPKPKANLHKLNFDFAKYPPIEFAPGMLVDFTGKQWSDDLTLKKNTYRLREFYLSADASNFEFKDDVKQPHQEYAGTAYATFELKEEENVLRPDYDRPFFPFPHDGKIFSEKGDEKDVNFDLYEDGETKLLYYTVNVKCETNKAEHKVKAPFIPSYINGEQHYPLRRDQVVRLNFDLYTAEIVTTLEPLALMSLPHDTQGNQQTFNPVLGDTQSTVMQHFDEEGHLVFFIKRREKPQIQEIKIKEDGYHVLVYADDKETTPQCHFHMDNEHTITIVSENKDSDETQKMVLKPEEISLLCKKGGDQSTIVQTPKSITIKCQEFKLETDTTELVSTKETKCKGKTVEIEGSSGIDIKDGASVKVGAKTIDVEGKTTNIMGSTVNIG